ncbi:MAG: hypothetical protein M1337_03440 [Actinobacteria bacterium]|nr:hypothetical protein [Actinomycetota bacterium]
MSNNLPPAAERLLDRVPRALVDDVRDIIAEATATREAEIRTAVEALPTHVRRNGWATGTVWVTLRAVLAAIDSPAPAPKPEGSKR